MKFHEGLFELSGLEASFVNTARTNLKISNIFLNLDSFLLIWTSTLMVCQWSESLDA